MSHSHTHTHIFTLTHMTVKELQKEKGHISGHGTKFNEIHPV